MDDDEFKRRVIADGVRKLFDGGHVCVCDFKRVTRLAGVTAPYTLQQWFQNNHCTDWGEIDSEMQREILKRTLTAFVHNRLPLDAIDECLGLSAAPAQAEPLRLATPEPHPKSPLASMAKDIADPITHEVERLAKEMVRSVDERIDRIIENRLAEKTKPGFFARMLGSGS